MNDWHQNDGLPNIVLPGQGLTGFALSGVAKLSPSWTGFDKFCIIHKADENNSMPNIRPYGMGLAKHSSLLDGVWLLVVRRLLCRAQRIRATRCFGSPARESSTTRHAQKVRINPPPCFAILSTRMRLIMTIACPAPVPVSYTHLTLPTKRIV